jgi:hypothetical protein
VGVELMKDLVTAVVRATQAGNDNRELLIEIRDLLVEEVELRKQQLEAEDALAGELATLGRALEILHDENGHNRKVTLTDFVQAWSLADEEMRRDDEGESDPGGDDGGDQDDPAPTGGGGRFRETE